MPDLDPFTRFFVTRVSTAHPIILHSTGHPVVFQPGVDRMLSVEFIVIFISSSLLNAVPTEGSTKIRTSDVTSDYFFIIQMRKGKAIPLQAWKGPEGSSRLRLPDFKTIGT